jgi:hypothetical protein
VNVIALVGEPLHTTTFAGWVTVGVGLTVMVNVWGCPEQPSATGVTVIVATTGTVPVLTALKVAIFPVPLAPNPTEVVLLVHV